MYRIMVSDEKTKDIFNNVYANMISFLEDDVDVVSTMVEYFFSKDLTVIVEKEDGQKEGE